MWRTDHPLARTLSERFCPNTGAPVRVGMVWPPRLVVHDVARKGSAQVNEAIASVWIRHHIRHPVEVIIRPGDAPAHDPNGQPVPGLAIGRSARTVERSDAWQLMPITLQWTPELQRRMEPLLWVRKELVIELKQDGATRSFQWYVYLTPGPPQLPRHASLYDDHPHYRWVDHHGGPVGVEGVSPRWIELPAPMSSPALTPACWLQERRIGAGAPGPDTLDVVPVFPLEPAVPQGLEVAGWNGALGGHDRRPMLLPLGLRSLDRGTHWSAALDYWDTPLAGGSGPIHTTAETPLEPPTPCVWPRVLSAEEQPVDLYQLREPTERGTDVLLNLTLRLPEDAEPMRVERADILLGTERIGHWNGPLELYAGRTWSLPCVIDQDRIARVGQERMKLTFAFAGRPSRGVCATVQQFRTENGPYVRIHRTRYTPSRRPWLVIDLGTEGTCAAVAFLDGFAPRVLTVPFADGPIHPSRVHIAPGQGGAWTLTDQPGDDALYTTGIKLGLRFGDGAHPGCPDHVSALEVARFYLRRFLLELRERAAWFPLESCDVLVSFPPRLVCMPRFVAAMREAFRDVVPEVIWPNGRHGRIRFREEAFLVAMPSLYKDLQLAPLAPGRSRYYWVMDFGGGTTDICGFLCTADAYGEEQTISHFSYPQRFPHHLSGNDITAAFYATLRRHLVLAGVVAGTAEGMGGRHFVFPEDPFPSTRSTHTALLNQTALRELADILKCTPVAAQPTLSVRDLAKTLRSTTVRSVDGIATTLVAVLADEARDLGSRSVERIHADVLDPGGARGTVERETPGGLASRRDADTRPVACVQCGQEHQLPDWVFSSRRPFRFRCSRCGTNQHVEGGTGRARRIGEGSTTTALLADEQLLLKQDHQNYRVDSWETVRRWIGERRVGPDDRISTTGVTWDRLADRPELADLFGTAPPADAVGWDDPATEVQPDDRRALPWADESEGLGVGIERFLTACQQALDDARARLPEMEVEPEVVLLLAGRASLFAPITEGIQAVMQGRLVHLTNAWVRRAYGTTGTIDPTAGLKTLTVNGGGLFALNQTNADTAHLLLSFDTARVDCHTYLDTGELHPFWLTRQLDLSPGGVVELVEQDAEAEAAVVPLDHPLLGDVRLQIEGLPEDRAWEPWVTIARGTLRRVGGHRARTTSETRLETHRGRFVLTGLTQEASLTLTNLLPELELLGNDS